MISARRKDLTSKLLLTKKSKTITLCAKHYALCIMHVFRKEI